jgi:UDP-N-acetylmuramoylalanine--D-glutamate ligase
MRFEDFRGQRLVVLGFGREGQSAWQALKQRSDPAGLEVWSEAGELPDAVQGRIAPFDEGLADFDIALRSPGIRVDHPALQAFRARGGRVVNPSSIFLSERPDLPVVGVTGSKGKSTTASILAQLLRANGQDAVLAGNIGVPLLDHLDTRADRVVAELSSYQLADLQGRLELGLITRLFPEHLDWHGSLAAYYQAKLRLGLLLAGAPLLINGQDPVLERETRAIAGRRLANQAPGFHREEDALYRDRARQLGSDELSLIGRHNLDNAALALTASEMLGGVARTSVDALRRFRPLVHRLEAIGERWINDSIATSPHATRAALECLRDRRVVLIAGGQARPADWSPVIDWCRRHPLAGLITLPDNGAAVAEALLAGQAVASAHVFHADTLEAAVAAADRRYAAGEVIVLSPGAPSFPRFRSFEERGERFRASIAAAGGGQG